MCKAVEEWRQEERAEGLAEGRAEGRYEELLSLVNDGLLSAAIASSRCGKTESEFEKLLKEFRER